MDNYQYNNYYNQNNTNYSNNGSTGGIENILLNNKPLLIVGLILWFSLFIFLVSMLVFIASKGNDQINNPGNNSGSSSTDSADSDGKETDGTEKVKVPDVINLTEDEAVKNLTDAGLYADVVYVDAYYAESGVVIAQKHHDEEVKTGTMVELIACDTKAVKCPNITGGNKNHAIIEIKNAGLLPNCLYMTSEDYDQDMVIDQTMNRDETITLISRRTEYEKKTEEYDEATNNLDLAADGYYFGYSDEGERYSPADSESYREGDTVDIVVSTKNGIQDTSQKTEMVDNAKINETPTISNAQIKNITSDGYDITCNVNSAVTKVLFPTWNRNLTAGDEQDDLKWHEGTLSNGVATCHISISEHNNEYGEYLTNIYAYDDAGNEASEKDIEMVELTYYDSPHQASFNGHTYIFVCDAITWKMAYDACEKYGGNYHLATVTSDEEHEFIMRMINGMKDKPSGYWLGAYDYDEEGVWKWDNGEPFSYNRWPEGQPDNTDSKTGEEENYLGIWIDGTWNDFRVDYRFGYILESD